MALRRRAWEALLEAEATEDPLKRQELFALSKRYQSMARGSEPQDDEEGDLS